MHRFDLQVALYSALRQRAPMLCVALFLVACAQPATNGVAPTPPSQPEPHLPADPGLSATGAQRPTLCSAGWLAWVERQLVSGDGQGHGPDVGSDEWRSVIEFRLGIRGNAQVPARSSEAWCRYIDQQLRMRQPQAAAPAWCQPQPQSRVEKTVCTEPDFWARDALLAQVYQQASQQASGSADAGLLPSLRAQQRGWIKGRNDCWKAGDLHACIAQAYELRTAELQTRYRLVTAMGPVFFYCGGNPANEIVITYFQTEPPSLVVERGDQTALMFSQPAASGSRYQGRNEHFWEHQGQVSLTWGADADAESCVQAR